MFTNRPPLLPTSTLKQPMLYQHATAASFVLSVKVQKSPQESPVRKIVGQLYVTVSLLEKATWKYPLETDP